MPADETELVRARYDRIAPLYDGLQWLMERSARRWRRDQWANVRAGRVLEIGVGTGDNVPFYPPDAEIVATDISSKMLGRARRRAQRPGSKARFELADAQELPYPDASFDVAVGTFVFCSVPDAGRGLRELRRVLRPGGRLILLEHVLSARPVLRRLMQWMDFMSARLWGAHMNRDTVAEVRRAGFEDVRAQPLWLDVVQRIEASAPAG